jgi:hypothetical protein
MQSELRTASSTASMVATKMGVVASDSIAERRRLPGGSPER